MGNVIRPWQFRIRPYVKWQIENKRGQIARDEALRAARRAKRPAAAVASPRLEGASTDGSSDNPRQ